MKVPKQSRREAKQLFRCCQVNGLLDENRARSAVAQMLSLRPRGYMAILNYFQRLIKLDLERRAARVESVIPLNAEYQGAIKANLERRYGPGLNFTFSQNPGLLGGIRIRVGSDVYDGSVQARLNDVRQAFESV